MTPFERRARTLLEGSAQGLSAGTRSRLTRARYAALEHRTGAAASDWWRRWLPAGAVSAAALAVLLVVGQISAPKAPQASVGGGEDLELLADSDALAIAQDQPAQEAGLDYEFYAWAATESDAGHIEVGS